MLRKATEMDVPRLCRSAGGTLLGDPASTHCIRSRLAAPGRIHTREPAQEADDVPIRIDRALNALAWISLGLIVAMLLTGCSTPPMHDQVMGSGYVATNYFRAGATLPARIKSVAVLPMQVPSHVPDEALEVLEPVLQENLLRVTIAEWRFLTGEELRRVTGQRSWTPEERLPKDLMATLKDRYGCDAILFSQLTRYHPFSPVTLGWRFKLVDCSDASLLWAADETFDSGVPPIAASARRYYQKNIHSRSLSEDSRMVLQSPRYFGQYTIQALLETLPGR
jgi:hypothetical protein